MNKEKIIKSTFNFYESLECKNYKIINSPKVLKFKDTKHDEKDYIKFSNYKNKEYVQLKIKYRKEKEKEKILENALKPIKNIDNFLNQINNN